MRESRSGQDPLHLLKMSEHLKRMMSCLLHSVVRSVAGPAAAAVVVVAAKAPKMSVVAVEAPVATAVVAGSDSVREDAADVAEVSLMNSAVQGAVAAVSSQFQMGIRSQPQTAGRKYSVKGRRVRIVVAVAESDG